MPFLHCTETELGACFPTLLEPVSAWHAHARQLGSLLTVCARLHAAERISEDQFAEAVGLDGPEEFHRWVTQVELEIDEKITRLKRQSFERTCVAILINKQLSIGNVRPDFQWTNEGPRVTWAGGGLLGALATRLAFAASRIDQFAICSGCGVAFVPERLRARGRSRWCGKGECERVAWVLASRRYRAGESKKQRRKRTRRRKGR
jgi:hypothetical protein